MQSALSRLIFKIREEGIKHSCSLILLCLMVAPLIPILLTQCLYWVWIHDRRSNSHTLQSGFVLSLHSKQFPSLVVPHFESLLHHVTMANKICFGHKIPHPPAHFAHKLLTQCHKCTEQRQRELIQSEAAVLSLLDIWSLHLFCFCLFCLKETEGKKKNTVSF